MGKIPLAPGVSVDIPEDVTTWETHPEFALSSEDFRSSPHRMVRRFVLHTTRGVWPQVQPSDTGPSGSGAENNARYWRREKRSASTTLLVDLDGSAVATHYSIPVIAWHAKDASMDSIGIENVQGPGPENRVYMVQARTCAHIIGATIRANHPQVNLFNSAGKLEIRTNYDPRTAMNRMVRPGVPGIFGHRDVRPMDRTRGDPGDWIMNGVADELERMGFPVLRT